jgi:hypothetical protein
MFPQSEFGKTFAVRENCEAAFLERADRDLDRNPKPQQAANHIHRFLRREIAVLSHQHKIIFEAKSS